jgi:hypothetical protein
VRSGTDAVVYCYCKLYTGEGGDKVDAKIYESYRKRTDQGDDAAGGKSHKETANR